MQRKVTELEARLESVDLGEGASASGAAASSDAETKRLQSELAAAQEQLEMKVNQTPAVQNMKKMLQEKN